MPNDPLTSALAKLSEIAAPLVYDVRLTAVEAAALLADRARMVDAIQLARKWTDAPGACFLKMRKVRGALAQADVLASSPSPSFWPGDVPGGESGYTDHEEVGPIGAGTPHARMKWFWERMHPHNKLIEELTGWSPISSKYRFEAAVADAFDKLAESHEGETK